MTIWLTWWSGVLKRSFVVIHSSWLLISTSTKQCSTKLVSKKGPREKTRWRTFCWLCWRKWSTKSTVAALMRRPTFWLSLMMLTDTEINGLLRRCENILTDALTFENAAEFYCKGYLMQHLFEDGSNGIHSGKLHQGPKTEWMVPLHDEFKLVQGHGGNPWSHNVEEVSSFLC